MAKWTDAGENRVLDILLGATPVDTTLYLGLYQDVAEPGETEALADLTEPSGSGYARIALSRGSWSIVDDLATYAEQTFTASGGDWGDITGAFITDVASGTSGDLIAVQSFAAARTINDGDSLKVTPKIRAA